MATVWDLFRMGGPFMWLLLAFLIVLLFAIVRQSIRYALFDFRIDETAAKNVISGETPAGRSRFYTILHDNAALCGTDSEAFDRFMTSECQTLLDGLRSGLGLMSGLAAIAPVTGFLGTVVGMIEVFRSITAASDVSAQLVASGIYEALITTAAGLIISIIASIAYFIFAAIAGFYASSMEHCTASAARTLYSREVTKR